jgi:chorismate-pyruvate lyase
MPASPNPSTATPELTSLVELFYPSHDELGTFVPVQASALPPAFSRLLNHSGHMTETVEDFFGGEVDVRVLDKKVTRSHYARKILLARHRDGLIVQFGIMRIAFGCLDDEVRRKIESEFAPLGRILVEHDILRTVRLMALWQVTTGPELRSHFHLERPETTYGRTAMIYLDKIPSVELLEIIAPCAREIQT